MFQIWAWKILTFLSIWDVKGVVVLGLFRDPAGNPMGLVEMDGNQPKVP